LSGSYLQVEIAFDVEAHSGKAHAGYLLFQHVGIDQPVDMLTL
jgi:hypothetical protein